MRWIPASPRQTTTAISRSVSAAPAQAAERVARLARGVPDERLEQVMRSPLRRLILETIFWQMPRQVDRKRAAGVTTSVRWEITRHEDAPPDTFQLEFNEGQCRVRRGTDGADPRVTITVDGAEFLRIAVGGSDAMRAYFKGRISLSGDIMSAAKLASLFVIPGRSR